MAKARFEYMGCKLNDIFNNAYTVELMWNK